MLKPVLLSFVILCLPTISQAIDVNSRDDIGFEVDPQDLLVSKELDLANFIVDKKLKKSNIMKKLDIKNLLNLPDSLIVASKYAAILNYKKPEYFDWTLVSSENFHASLYKNQTTRKIADNLIETKTAVKFLNISWSHVISQTTSYLYDRSNKGRYWDQLSSLDAHLGEPSKILITEASRGNHLLLGSTNVYIFYDYSPHTVLVGYQIAATNLNDLGKVGTYMAKRKAKSEVKDSLEFRVENLRNFR